MSCFLSQHLRLPSRLLDLKREISTRCGEQGAIQRHRWSKFLALALPAFLTGAEDQLGALHAAAWMDLKREDELGRYYRTWQRRHGSFTLDAAASPAG